MVVALLVSVLSTQASAGVEWIEEVDYFDGTTGTAPSLELDADGRPAVAYFSPEIQAVSLLRCSQRSCRSGGNINSIASIPNGNAWPSLRLTPQGNPVVAYLKDGRIEVIRCDDPNCDDGGDVVNVIAGEPGILGFPQLALSSGGFPVVAYALDDLSLRIRKCITRTCSLVNAPVQIEGRALGGIPALEIGPDDAPILAFTTWTADGQPTPLSVVRCLSHRCVGGVHVAEMPGYFSNVSLDLATEPGRTDYGIVVGSIEGSDDEVRDFAAFACHSEACNELERVISPSLLNDRSPHLADMVLSDTGPVFVYADLDLTESVHVASFAPLPPGVEVTVDDIRVMAPDPEVAGYMWPEIELRDDGTAVLAYVTFTGINVTECDDSGCIPVCNGQPVTVDHAVGGAFGQAVAGDVVRGTNQNDTLTGGSVICGLRGNDTIRPSPNAAVFAGAGNDTIILDAGKNFVSGGPGHDRIIGASGRDRLFGGPGNDFIDGRGGADRISGGDGNDEIYGSWGSDKLFGNLGRDTIDGGDGNDIIKGGGWLDSVDGGDGVDDRCGIVEGETRLNCERGIFGL